MFPQLVERMLKDKFYAGILINPWTKEENFGLHSPMISLDEHHQIQAIKTGISNNATQCRLIANIDFPLRRFVRCVCGKGLTASWHTGRRGRRYAYYNCRNPECDDYGQYIKIGDLEGKFLALLGRVTPNGEFLELFEKNVIKNWEEQTITLGQIGQNYTKGLKQLEDKKEKLLEMRVSGEISKDEFVEMKDRIDNQIAGLRISQNETKIDELDAGTAVSYATQFISDLVRQWQDIQDAKQKQQFQKMVLPEGLTYDITTESFGTAVLSPIFKLSEEFDGDISHLVAELGHHWHEIEKGIREIYAFAS